MVRPAKYPSAIANTKQQIVVNCVSTIVYRRNMPPATGLRHQDLRYASDRATGTYLPGPRGMLQQKPLPY